jgi:AcrR family transcriptional regulator
LFHERGFGATGIATVLRRANVKSGSLYHFFASKEALLEGVLEQHLALLQPTVISPVEKAVNDPIERVFALLDLYRRNLRMSGWTQGCPVGNLALEVGDQFPQARALMEQYFANWAGAVRGWLDEAGERLPGDVDRNALARLVLTVMEGGVMQARAQGSPDGFDATVMQLKDYVGHLERRAASTAAPDEGPAANGPGLRPDEPGWRIW